MMKMAVSIRYGFCGIVAHPEWTGLVMSCSQSVATAAADLEGLVGVGQHIRSAQVRGAGHFLPVAIVAEQNFEIVAISENTRHVIRCLVHCIPKLDAFACS